MNIYFSKRWPMIIVRAGDLEQAAELVINNMLEHGLPAVDTQPYIDSPEIYIEKLDPEGEADVLAANWS